MARQRTPAGTNVREFQPRLWRLPYSLPALLEEVRLEHFRHLPAEIPVNVTTFRPLSCIVHADPVAPAVPRIFVHELLNHEETPREVLRSILKHELLHCVVQPRQIGGEMEPHPPEFLRAERELAPESAGAWRWMRENFGPALRHEREGVKVKPSWQRFADSPRGPYMPPLFPH